MIVSFVCQHVIDAPPGHGSEFVQDWFGPEQMILVQNWFGRRTLPAGIIRMIGFYSVQIKQLSAPKYHHYNLTKSAQDPLHTHSIIKHVCSYL